MVKAGYVHPDEILESSGENVLDEVATTQIGMQRASQIFLDHVVNVNQDLLSPQYSQFYEAAEASAGSSEEKIQDGFDNHNALNLHTLSSTLIGIQQQMLSYRRDAADRDYPSKFYEDYLDPDNKLLR